jgi:uncharacterized membrane protein YwzB
MDSELVISIIVIVYMIWAIYSGWKFINGRFDFLEKKEAQYKILKVIIAILIGIVYGFINMFIALLKWIFRFLEYMRKM